MIKGLTSSPHPHVCCLLNSWVQLLWHFDVDLIIVLAAFRQVWSLPRDTYHVTLGRMLLHTQSLTYLALTSLAFLHSCHRQIVSGVCEDVK